MAASDAPDDEARRLRAIERARIMTLRRATLTAADAERPTTGLAAMELTAELSLAAWSISGRPLPAYTRATMPYVFVRNPRSG
jgi:hypothetical protein